MAPRRRTVAATAAGTEELSGTSDGLGGQRRRILRATPVPVVILSIINQSGLHVTHRGATRRAIPSCATAEAVAVWAHAVRLPSQVTSLSEWRGTL